MQIYYNARVSFSSFADILQLQSFIVFKSRYIITPEFHFLHLQIYYNSRVSFSFYSCFSWLSLLLFPTEGFQHFYLFLLQGFIIIIYSFFSFLSYISIPASGCRHIFIYCCFRVLSYFTIPA